MIIYTYLFVLYYQIKVRLINGMNSLFFLVCGSPEKDRWKLGSLKRPVCFERVVFSTLSVGRFFPCVGGGLGVVKNLYRLCAVVSSCSFLKCSAMFFCADLVAFVSRHSTSSAWWVYSSNDSLVKAIAALWLSLSQLSWKDFRNINSRCG